jgi:hypothetical protein
MKQVGKKILIKSLIINYLTFYFLPIYLPLHALVDNHLTTKIQNITINEPNASYSRSYRHYFGISPE